MSLLGTSLSSYRVDQNPKHVSWSSVKSYKWLVQHELQRLAAQTASMYGWVRRQPNLIWHYQQATSACDLTQGAVTYPIGLGQSLVACGDVQLELHAPDLNPKALPFDFYRRVACCVFE